MKVFFFPYFVGIYFEDMQIFFLNIFTLVTSASISDSCLQLLGAYQLVISIFTIPSTLINWISAVRKSLIIYVTMYSRIFIVFCML